MKKYISFILLAGVILGTPLVRAEDGDSTSKGKRPAFTKEMFDARKEFREQMQKEREEFQQKLRTEREEFLKELETKKEEWKTANAEKRNDFWGKSRAMIGERFNVAISKLEAVQERVSNAIDKLEDEGKDTDLAEEALASSKTKLAEAKTKLAKINDLLETADGDKVTPEVFAEIKVLAREAKDLLKESKEYLHQAIKEIKNLTVGDEDENEDENENEDEDENS